MTQNLASPLASFADALPVPQRLIAARQNGELNVGTSRVNPCCSAPTEAVLAWIRLLRR